MLNLSPKCPACDNPESIQEGRVHRFHKVSFTLYCCPRCELFYWDPLYIDPTLYKEIEEPLYGAYHADLMGDSKMADSPLDRLPLESGRLLDIGCANGTLMLHAQNRGFEVHGIDFDSISVAKAQQKGLENAHAMSLDEFMISNDGQSRPLFDVITFFDVLEHQDDPQRFIRQVRELLKPGGYILGKVPNRNRFLQKVRYMLDYDYPPHHLLMWSSEALRHFLADQGFQDIVSNVPPFDFKRFIWHLEKKILGRGLAKTLKGMVFGVDDNLANIPCETLEKHTGKSGSLLRSLKKIEDFVFAILAAPLFPFYRHRNNHIIFSAKK
ncbi:MAG: methyltransferase domain-containing protein [Geobacter sp.]|nr:methyltransferase domain-containing protein [Geobacter sp.]